MVPPFVTLGKRESVPPQDSWEQMPALAVGRRGMACGAAADGDDLVVVAAGGFDDVEQSDSAVVEIFSLQLGEWRMGKMY